MPKCARHDSPQTQEARQIQKYDGVRAPARVDFPAPPDPITSTRRIAVPCSLTTHPKLGRFTTSTWMESPQNDRSGDQRGWPRSAG